MSQDNSKNISDIEADDDEIELNDEQPSLLRILIEKEKDINQTISLLQDGIAVASGLPSPTASSKLCATSSGEKKKIDESKFEGLNNLLSDNGVKSIISNIAGQNTQKLIDSALSDINSKSSLDDKQTALATGLRKIHSNLQGSNLANMNDPRLAAALKMLNLRKDRLI